MNLSWCHVDRYEEDSDAQKTAKQLTKIKLEIWRTLLTAMLFKVDWKGRWHDVRKRKCARGSKTDKLLIWPADKMSYSSFGKNDYLYFLLFFVLISCQHKWTGYGRSKPRNINLEIEIYLILILTKTFYPPYRNFLHFQSCEWHLTSTDIRGSVGHKWRLLAKKAHFWHLTWILCRGEAFLGTWSLYLQQLLLTWFRLATLSLIWFSEDMIFI